MKTTRSYLSNIARSRVGIVALLGLTLSSASALTSVSVPLSLAGKNLIGSGLTIDVGSGLKRLDKASAYSYKIVGTVSCPDKTTTIMSLLVPKPIALPSLLNSFSSGSGTFLIGSYLNPNMTFPIKAYKKLYNKVISTAYGDITITMNFAAGVRGGPLNMTHDGQVYFTLTNVSIVPPPFPIAVGTLQFDPGSKLVISVKP